MARAVSATDAGRLASQALSGGLADDPLARSRGRLLEPVVIQSPDGERAGWLVPVGLDGLMLGFVQLALDGTFRRYATFHSRPLSSAGCPLLADWLDPDVITSRARTLLSPGSRLDDPVLTYDRHPDRVAWLVRAVAPDGTSSAVMIAGADAWRAP